MWIKILKKLKLRIETNKWFIMFNFGIEYYLVNVYKKEEKKE